MARARRQFDAALKLHVVQLIKDQGRGRIRKRNLKYARADVRLVTFNLKSVIAASSSFSPSHPLPHPHNRLPTGPKRRCQ